MVNKAKHHVLRIIASIILFLIFAQTVAIAQSKMSYYYDAASTKTIEDLDFKEFISFDSPINNGINYGTYWVKISELNAGQVVSIPNAHIYETRLYRNGKEVNRSKANFFYFKITEPGDVILKAECPREGFVPITISNQNIFEQQARTNFLRYGLYYGFAVMVLIMNLFFFFSFKERTFLYYCIFLASLSLGLFYKDGLLHFLCGAIWLTDGIEIFSHLAIIIGGYLFASSYLEHEINAPRLKYIFYSLFAVTGLLYILYLLTENGLYFAIGDIFAIMVLASCWLSSVYLWKESMYAKVFSVAYFLILILGFDYFIFTLWGLPNLGLSAGLIKIGGVFEMLTLSFAVIYRIRSLQSENKEMQERLFNHVSQVESLEEELFKLRDGRENLITKAALSNREIEILELIAKGKTNKEMALDLNISVNTVKYHTKKLYEKLEISSRQEARKKAALIQHTAF